MGYKGLAWKSVQIPVVMPKPDLTCLTGGYRKTPVLQIGADIYCDTKTIARALEKARPQPTLYPPNTEATERALSSLGDAMFMAGFVVMLGAGMMPPEFLEDRQKMIATSFDMDDVRRLLPSKRDQIRSSCAALDAQLADGRPFLLGKSICLADFSVYNPISFLSLTPPTAEFIGACKHLGEWRERMAAIGHGQRTEMSAADAITIARDSRSTTETRVDANEPNGYAAGDRLTVVPEDYGLDPVTGELVYSDAYEIALRRSDPRAGEVVVHFPRQGYLTLRA